METEEAIIRIFSAMDKALEAYELDVDTVFSNQTELKKFMYDPEYIRSLSWKDENICVYKGCTEKAIKSSHTIQKSTSLTIIAENNHLLNPKFNYRKEVYGLSLIGINEASTFLGFCPVHELLFSQFESRRDFQNEQDFRLQIYRTICREIIVNKRAVSSSIYRRNQYTFFRDEKLNELIQQEVLKQNLESGAFQSIKHKYNDKKIRFISNYIKTTESYLVTLDKLHDAALNDVKKSKVQQIFFEAIAIDWVIPCCLAGRGGIVVQTGAKNKVIDMILNVLPYEDKTYLILATLHKNKPHLKRYLERYINHPFSIITMVESWLLYGSDHWFLKPSIWQDLGSDHQAEFIDEIFSSKNINAIPGHPIFNKLKVELNEKMQT